MYLAEILRLPVTDNFLQINPGLKVSPELVLINLEELQHQLTSGDLDPTEYLDPQELAALQQFKYQKRQIEWLGGRLAAKQAVLLLQGQKLTGPAMREWPIFADEHGKPFFKILKNDLFSLSISHSHGLALAMTIKKGICGLDIQKISGATIRVKEKFCSPEEEKIINSLDLPDKNQETGLTLLWATKEALRKARGGHPLTGFISMQLTEALTTSNHCWFFTIRINSEKYQIPAFFYKDFAIALSVI